jgi:hypothetical protein
LNVKDYLISTHGMSEEDAKVIADNPKYAGVYEKLAREAEDGKTAFLKANETKAALEQWNQNTVIPYVRDADNKVAGMSAKLSAQATYLKSLKDAGYDIPSAYLDDAPANGASVVAQPVAAQGKDYDDLIQKGQLAQMELIDLANEAYDLTGKRVSVNAEYQDFQQNMRPGENLRRYITRKYDLDSIRTTRSKEAEQKKLDDYAATKVAAEKAEWAKSHGTNPDTLIPRASKFDRVVEARKADGSEDKEGRPLWQTQAGRAEATKRRLEKYSGSIN